MTEMLAAACDGVDPVVMDEIWNDARRVIERHVCSHLSDAGIGPREIGLKIEETEHPERRGHPSLRLAMGGHDAHAIVHLDWHGALSWRRPRRWLSYETRRAIARRRWMLAMVDRGVDHQRASLQERCVNPLLRPWTSSGMLSMEGLATSGIVAGGRYHVIPHEHVGRSSHRGREYRRIIVPDVPEMDVHVDYDRVHLVRMRLSRDVTYEHRDADPPLVRIRRHGIPQTLMTALAGQPLRRLVDFPMLDRDDMPVIDRLRTGRDASIEAILRSDGEGRIETRSSDA